MENNYQSWLEGKTEYVYGRFSRGDAEKIQVKSKEILLAEVDRQFSNEKRRIEKNLRSAPSPEKYIQSEIDVIFRILQKDIDYHNDCFKDMDGGATYYKTGRFDIDVKEILKIKSHYRNYLAGNINCMSIKPDKSLVMAIMYYQLDAWIKGFNPEKQVESPYSVKSILLAYYYMNRKGINPIPDLFDNSIKREIAFRELKLKYGKSWTSFRNDCNPIFKTKELRTPDRIKSAIKLISSFDYPNINEVIELAKQELNEAELKR